MNSSFVKFFPSLNGDSILVKIENYLMLIDGGYVNTYRDFIRPELIKLSMNNVCLNKIVVTHIDKDHISGIIELLRENTISPFIQINDIWHNSFKHIKQFNLGLDYSGKSVQGLQMDYVLQEEFSDTTQNISAIQGSTLASILLENNYNWNSEFDGNAISVDNKSIINLTDKVSLKLLSPTEEKLSALNLDWKKELYKKGYCTSEDIEKFSEIAFESIVARQKEKRLIKNKNISSTSINVENMANSTFIEDDSSANGSSIAFILEYQEKKLLFLADSHPSTIIKNLKLHYSEKEFPIYFNAIKVSHHGSEKNTSMELLKLIKSEQYIFSTNGKVHNHPDHETMCRIIYEKTPYTKSLFLTYPLESVSEFKDPKLMKEYNYKIIEMNGSQPIKIDL